MESPFRLQENPPDSLFEELALVGLSFAVLLFGVAMIANVSQSPMPQLRGAWVAQALR
jgi:hypothetical protein